MTLKGKKLLFFTFLKPYLLFFQALSSSSSSSSSVNVDWTLYGGLVSEAWPSLDALVRDIFRVPLASSSSPSQSTSNFFPGDEDRLLPRAMLDLKPTFLLDCVKGKQNASRKGGNKNLLSAYINVLLQLRAFKTLPAFCPSRK